MLKFSRKTMIYESLYQYLLKTVNIIYEWDRKRKYLFENTRVYLRAPPTSRSSVHFRKKRCRIEESMRGMLEWLTISIIHRPLQKFPGSG